jgi:hypothetical protein
MASNPSLRKGIFCRSLEDLRVKVGERFKLRRQQRVHLTITTGIWLLAVLLTIMVHFFNIWIRTVSLLGK